MKSPKVPAAAALQVGLLLLAACHHPATEAIDTQESVPVAVATAHAGRIRAVVPATGQVKPAAGADFQVVPPQQARIAEMPRLVGDRVRRGDLLVRFDIPSLAADAAARQSDLQRGQAQLETARQNLTRLSGLNDRGIASRKEVEDARRDVAQAEATVAEARTAVAMADRLGERAVVRSPFAGVVIARAQHQAGDLVDAGAAEPLLRVIDPSRLQVDAAVPAGDLGRIAAGSPARVRGGAFADETARVLAAPAAVDPATGTAPVRLAFDAPTRRPAGLPVEVEIYGKDQDAAVLVPAEALVQEGQHSVVFTVDGQKKAHRRQVTVGVVAGGQAEITAGVKAGEAVVVRGQTSLPDGAAVEVAAETPPPAEPAP